MDVMKTTMMWNGMAMFCRLRRMNITPLDREYLQREREQELAEAKAANLPLMVEALASMDSKFSVEYWQSEAGQKHERSLRNIIRTYDRIPENLLFKAMTEASELSLQEPLHYALGEERFIVPAWHRSKKISGSKVITILAFGLFIYMGEDEEACAPLLEMAPIKTALMLSEPTGFETVPLTPREIGVPDGEACEILGAREG